MTCRCLNGPLGDTSCIRCGRAVTEPAREHEGWSVLLQSVFGVMDGMDPRVVAGRAGRVLGRNREPTR